MQAIYVRSHYQCTYYHWRENKFHSVRHSNIWKAVNSDLKAIGRKTRLQAMQNTEREYRLKNNCMVTTP